MCLIKLNLLYNNINLLYFLFLVSSHSRRHIPFGSIFGVFTYSIHGVYVASGRKTFSKYATKYIWGQIKEGREYNVQMNTFMELPFCSYIPFNQFDFQLRNKLLSIWFQMVCLKIPNFACLHIQVKLGQGISIPRNWPFFQKIVFGFFG